MSRRPGRGPRASRRAAPLVRGVLVDQCRFERGSAELAEGDLVAVVAHWSEQPTITRSVATLVTELQQHGYRVVVTSSCQAVHPLVWPGLGEDLDALTVIRKPNVGYDFGSWTVALQLVPAALATRRTILTNDSMAGPFRSLGPILEGLDRTEADVWGLTDTMQFGSHLQSYFLGFCDGVLGERALLGFWADIRHWANKDDVIMNNELGLSRLLRQEGYIQAPEFPHEGVVAAGLNPVIKGWKRLLDRGFPFVKRELLRDPDVGPGARSIPATLQRRFGVDIRQWVDDPIPALAGAGGAAR